MQNKDFLAAMAEMMNPADPERLFVEWLVKNTGCLEEAVEELGVEHPPSGPRFYSRLMDAVTPVLVDRQKEDIGDVEIVDYLNEDDDVESLCEECAGADGLLAFGVGVSMATRCDDCGRGEKEEEHE